MSTDHGTTNAVIEAPPFLEAQFGGVTSRRLIGHLADWMRTRARIERLAFYPEWNVFRGTKRIQLRVTALE